MPNPRILLLAAAIVCASRAFACGPDFPNTLMFDRANTLEHLPIGSFDFEMRRLLVDPHDGLVAVEQGDYDPPQPADQLTVAGQGEVISNALYTQAAEAFHANDLDHARELFEEILALSDSQRSAHELAALYSIGRLEKLQGHGDAARAAFQRVRDLVKAGSADPDGLGVASFGEEARVQLDAGDFGGAIELYAEQTARGSASGISSLGFVFGQLIEHDSQLDAALANPTVRRLLPGYLNSRYTSFSPAQLAHVIERIDADKGAALAGMDRLAAALYRAGGYEAAESAAKQSDTALSWWVRAKLALRRGDGNQAAAAYAHASRDFPRSGGYREDDYSSYSDNESDGFSPKCRVDGESGILALSRGDYVSALGSLYAARAQYWQDAAYVAERVVTIEELRGFVDGLNTAQTDSTQPEEGVDQSYSDLRALLARRMLRNGLFKESLAYFDADPGIAEKAKGYVEALLAAASGGGIERAEANFAAAALANSDGMDLLGFEFDPDYRIYDGSYDLGRYNDVSADYTHVPVDHADINLGTRYLGNDEADRVAASRAVPLKRFHYRYVAADLAEQAADLLPARSQAYAAVLCMATGWINMRDHVRGEALWLRYVRNGAYVPWAADFGNECEMPDFPAAAERLHIERIAEVKRVIRAGIPYVAAIFILLGIVILVRVLGRKRRIRNVQS